MSAGLIDQHPGEAGRVHASQTRPQKGDEEEKGRRKEEGEQKKKKRRKEEKELYELVHTARGRLTRVSGPRSRA